MNTTSLRGSFRPKLETLEDRWCPAVSFDLIDGGRTLLLNAGSAANTVVIEQDDILDVLEVTGDNQTQTFKSSEIDKIVVFLGAGKDLFKYRLVGGSDFLHGKTLDLFGNTGDDTFLLNFAGNGIIGQETTLAADLAINLDAGHGNDNVSASFADVVNADIDFFAQMNSHSDVFTANLRGDLVGTADVVIEVNDEINVPLFIPVLGGKDRFTINAFNIDIEQNARLSVLMNGVDQDDRLAFNYRGDLDGFLTARLLGDFGGDTLIADVSLKAGSEGKLDVVLQGGSGKDTLIFDLIDNSDLVDIVNALVDGQAGNDTADTTPNVTRKNI